MTNETPQPKTFAEVRRVLSALGITIRPRDPDTREYRVNFARGREATAGYTDDLQDAYHTGLAMHREQSKQAGHFREGEGAALARTRRKLQADKAERARTRAGDVR